MTNWYDDKFVLEDKKKCLYYRFFFSTKLGEEEKRQVTGVQSVGGFNTIYYIWVQEFLYRKEFKLTIVSLNKIQG